MSRKWVGITTEMQVLWPTAIGWPIVSAARQQIVLEFLSIQGKMNQAKIKELTGFSEVVCHEVLDELKRRRFVEFIHSNGGQYLISKLGEALLTRVRPA